MIEHAALALWAAAALALALVVAQALALRIHLGRSPAKASRRPAISVLKPLCGIDDGLEENLAAFARLDYPEYEVVLGARSIDDAAWPVALAAARRWPGRFRAVVQRGEPGVNPKVNQLVTLARAARHGVLVVSDSNVRVAPDYLDEIAALLEDERVGLVTHLIAGEGEERLGSVLDGLHLAGAIAPGVAGARALAGHDVVVGKSMAFRRSDLAALGGFESVSDVLAEDYVLGRRVVESLGKRVAIARTPVRNFSQRRSLREFTSRYARWAVLQRQSMGMPAYVALLLLQPVPLAASAAMLAPELRSIAGLAGVCIAKVLVDAACGRALRLPGRRMQLVLVPFKDLLSAWAWAYGLVRSEVAWRGTRLQVTRGTRVVRLPEDWEDPARRDDRPPPPGRVEEGVTHRVLATGATPAR